MRFRTALCLAAAMLAPSALSVATASAAPIQIFSEFRHGFDGFNLGGVGDVYPKIVAAGSHSRKKMCRFSLQGDEERSELTVGGDGTANSDGTVQFREGAEYWYAFEFKIQQMAWGMPGAHNLIMQFHPNGEGAPNMALGLWDYEGEKGLWSEGDAMGGNRFLAPLTLHAWHSVEVHFRASGRGRGFYQVYLDGKLIDGRSKVDTIVPGKAYGFLKSGLYRNAEVIHARSVLFIDAVELSTHRPSLVG
jgi:polysaccharide lyase-like protein